MWNRGSQRPNVFPAQMTGYQHPELNNTSAGEASYGAYPSATAHDGSLGQNGGLLYNRVPLGTRCGPQRQPHFRTPTSTQWSPSAGIERDLSYYEVLLPPFAVLYDQSLISSP